MFSRPLLAVIALVATASAPALSQDFAGRWTGNGGTKALSVTFTQASSGEVRGDMRGGPLQVEQVIRHGGNPSGAWIEKGTLHGRAVSELNRWWFEGRLEGQVLKLWLVRADDDGAVPAATAGRVYTMARGDQPPPGNPVPTVTDAARAASDARAVQAGRVAEKARAVDSARAAAVSVTGTWTAASPTGTVTLTLRQEADKDRELNPVSGTLVRGGVTYEFIGHAMSVPGYPVIFGGGASVGDASVDVSGEMNNGQLNLELRVPRSRKRGILGSKDSLTFVRR